jgi:hypothetical protein
MSEASVPDHSEGTSDRVVVSAGNEAQNLDADDLVDDYYRAG